MPIEQLEITNFRNLEKVIVSPSSTLNAIIGNNGSGKTSILEAIYCLGTAKSFRTPHSKQAIQFGQAEFVVFGKIVPDQGASIPVGVSKDPHSIHIKIANQPATSASTLAGLLPIQLINPDVHKMLEEGPRYRRRFLEWGLFHVKPNYFPHWQECRHILKQRNAALKQNLPPREIDHWNIQLCEQSEIITSLRNEYLAELEPIVDRLFRQIEKLPKVEISLSQGWAKDRTLEDVLVGNYESDVQRGFTQYGPHRVDLSIRCQGVRAKDVVSRGQQKILTAIMKLAQLEMLNNLEQGAKGILLVDDLPAELDPEFRAQLIDLVRAQQAQTFITATESSMLFKDSIEVPATVFHVEHGQVIPAPSPA